MESAASKAMIAAESAPADPAGDRAPIQLPGGEGDQRRLLILGAASTVAFRVSATGLGFAASLLLARLLTTDGYGAYYFLMAALSFLAMPAGLGLPGIVTREVATFLGRREWSGVKGILRYTYRVSAYASLFAAATLVLSRQLGWDPPGGGWVLAASSSILVFSVLNDVTAAVQRGFQQVTRSQLPELARMSFFVIVLAGVWITGAAKLDVTHVIVLQAVATLGALLFGAALLIHGLVPHRLSWKRARPHYESRRWLAAGLPLMLLAGLSAINNNADILMLGGLVGNEAAAVYHAATRGANFLTLFLAAAIMPLGPMVARLYATDGGERLQRLLTRTTTGVFLATLPLALFFVLQGDWFLALFGEAFTSGWPALAILSVGHLFTVAAGPVMTILIMTRHERTATLGMGVGAVSNVALNALLIPRYGITGAAAATALSIVIWSLLLVIQVRRKTGLRPTILSGMTLKPSG